MFKTRDLWQSFYYSCWVIHKRKILIGIVTLLVAIVLAIRMIPPALDAARDGRELDQFLNQGNEALLYDFNYLMHTLEENWPFFNLSKSANGVDIHEVADNVRRILTDPATEDIGTHEFIDFLRQHFFWEIGRIGHLSPIWQYQNYFEELNEYEWISRTMRFTPTNVAMFQELHARPQTVMFYETFRDAGGSTLVHYDTQRIEEARNLPVYETAILEEGSIAYLSVSRMISMWYDFRQGGRNMGQYEALLYEFHGQIEGFDHLIIDLRGNLGGVHQHFNVFVVAPLLREGINFPAYVFYKGGEYSRMARENHDLGMWGSTSPFVQHAANFAEPLPYLDTEIDLPYVFESAYMIAAGYMFVDWYASAREEVLFDGRVWVLTDENTGSAAESAVAMLKLNNLATVVGETTLGILGTMEDPTRMLMSLPNTGILISFDVAYFTDTLGRPLQGYGISPHYFNRPRLDALETVLAMIEELN